MVSRSSAIWFIPVRTIWRMVREMLLYHAPESDFGAWPTLPARDLLTFLADSMPAPEALPVLNPARREKYPRPLWR